MLKTVDYSTLSTIAFISEFFVDTMLEKFPSD